MACMHVSSSSYGMHACILLLIWHACMYTPPHMADDLAHVSSDVPGRHMVAGEGGHVSKVRSRLITARRTSSASSSVLDHTSHLETQRDTETKGPTRGLRRAASERSFRVPSAAARGAGLEGGSGGGQVQALQALESKLPPLQLAHASQKGEFDLRLKGDYDLRLSISSIYPASTSHPAPLSAPHSSAHSSPHTPVPHSAHVGVAPTPTQRPHSAGGGEPLNMQYHVSCLQHTNVHTCCPRINAHTCEN